jgi:hypothetical protein
MKMTAEQRREAIERVLDDIPRRLASREINRTGRFYTDDELAAGAALDGKPSPSKSTKTEPSKASAA